MSTYELIQTIASIATAIGVGIAASQLWLSKRQAQSQFEDSFAEQYRRIITDLPLDALIGKRLTEQELNDSLRTFYNYFDLSNEQAFLANQSRLRTATWKNWREGIDQNFARPGFQQAWERLAPDLDGSFDDLKEILPDHLQKIGIKDRPTIRFAGNAEVKELPNRSSDNHLEMKKGSSSQDNRRSEPSPLRLNEK